MKVFQKNRMLKKEIKIHKYLINYVSRFQIEMDCGLINNCDEILVHTRRCFQQFREIELEAFG